MKSLLSSPLPAQRYATQLARFERSARRAFTENRKTGNPVGAALFLADGRTPMFFLQGLARINSEVGPSRTMFTLWLHRFKEIEDLLGGYDFWVELGRRATEWEFPEPLIKAIEARRLRALGELEYGLHRADWIRLRGEAPPSLGEARIDFLGEIEGLDWLSPKRERRRLAAFIAGHARKTEARLKTGRLSLQDLEAGVHELRRRLRWIPIYAHALGGKLAWQEGAEGDDRFASYLTPDALLNRFNVLPENPREEYPVLLHRGAGLAIAHVIGRIGVFKDRAQWTEACLRLAKELGLAEREVLRKMGPAAITHRELVRGVKLVVQKVVIKDRALDVIASHLEEQARE